MNTVTERWWFQKFTSTATKPFKQKGGLQKNSLMKTDMEPENGLHGEWAIYPNVKVFFVWGGGGVKPISKNVS